MYKLPYTRAGDAADSSGGAQTARNPLGKKSSVQSTQRLYYEEQIRRTAKQSRIMAEQERKLQEDKKKAMPKINTTSNKIVQ